MSKSRAKIAIVGGGFGGVFTALELSGAGDVSLITPDDHFLFTPMLYEYVSGEVEAWHIAPYYNELLDDNVSLIKGTVSDIDVDRNTVSIDERADAIHFDVLVLAVGGVSNYWNIEGAAEYTMPFRKLEHADALRQRMVDALDAVPPDFAPQDVREALTFAVVGGGASGVELSTKMADLLRDAFQRRALRGEPRIMLIEMGEHVVPGMGDEIRTFVEDALRESRVEIHTGTRVLSVRRDGLTFEHKGKTSDVKAAATVWTAGVRVNPLIEKLPLEKDRRGLLLVQPTLQTKSHENIFALGDIALFEDASPRLAGTAQLAFQQASLAGDNIKALLAGKPLHTKHIQELGEAVSLGTERAAVLAGGRAFGGALARQARFTLYTSRLPTWHHRLKVGASWFFGGTQPRPLQPLGIGA